MTPEAPLPSESAKVLSQQRLMEALAAILATNQLSQRSLAARLQLPAHYLSDYKHRNRQLTERVARRIEEQFGYPWGWLMGISDEGAPAAIKIPEIPTDARGGNFLPILAHPIQGEPRLHPKWDGSILELPPAALAQLPQATQPYILRFGADDRENRLRRGDLVLMSQAPPVQNTGIESVIQVIRAGRGMYLARRRQEGWVHLAPAAHLSPTECYTVHGHAISIVWGRLL